MAAKTKTLHNFCVELKQAWSKTILEIYTVDGKLIYNNKLQGMKEKINISLSSGVYILSIKDNKNSRNQELIIQRE